MPVETVGRPQEGGRVLRCWTRFGFQNADISDGGEVRPLLCSWSAHRVARPCLVCGRGAGADRQSWGGGLYQSRTGSNEVVSQDSTMVLASNR